MCSSVGHFFGLNITSRWPLKAAWCRAVRPARSDTFTLLSRGTKASAQRTALLAAAMWSGVCQFLSLAFTSAECFSKTWTAPCNNNSCYCSCSAKLQYEKQNIEACMTQDQRTVCLPHSRRPQPCAGESATCYLWHLLLHLPEEQRSVSAYLKITRKTGTKHSFGILVSIIYYSNSIYQTVLHEVFLKI